MKVIVTHLKAPWPKGTKVDSIVTLSEEVLPAWAEGKCRIIGKKEFAALPEDKTGEAKDDKAGGDLK